MHHSLDDGISTVDKTDNIDLLVASPVLLFLRLALTLHACLLGLEHPTKDPAQSSCISLTTFGIIKNHDHNQVIYLSLYSVLIRLRALARAKYKCVTRPTRICTLDQHSNDGV